MTERADDASEHAVLASGDGRRALVTGGAGFIGGHLVESLVADGFRVRVLDDFSTGREENLAPVQGDVEVVRGDIRDAAVVARAVRGVELVFHQAAIASVPKSLSDPVGTHAVNVDGTLCVLDAARRAGVRRLVFAASAAAYGDGESLPARESQPARPLSPYGLHKYTCEHHCRLYSELFGLETTALRYFNVFGPRQDPAGDYAAVIPIFALACVADRPPRVFGDGTQTRDFVFVGDVVRANRLAAEAPATDGSLLNVATGRETSLNELLEVILDITGSGLQPEYAPAREGDVHRSVASIERARELMGYAPATDLRDGLERTVRHFQKTTAGPGGRS